MFACTVDHLVAVEGPFQIVPKSQPAASSITRQEQETAGGKKEGGKKEKKLLTYTWGNQA